MTQSIFRLKFFTTAFICSMVLAIAFQSCKEDDPVVIVDTTCLTAKIDLAQQLYDMSVEGTKPGQFTVGSRATLKAVIDAANTVLANTTATQADITNACAQLDAAIATFNAALIQEIAAANLIGFWKMNNNANDSSGKGNHGVLTIGHLYYGAGSATPTTDRFGRVNMAYHFDKGGNIEVPYTSALNPPEMTISVWCKKSIVGRTINPDTYTIVALNRWNGYKFQYQSANKLFYTVKVVNGPDTLIYDKDDEVAILDNDVWYHGVVTFKNGTMNFYVNGDLVKSWTDVPGNALTLATPINFVIGQDLPTSQYLTTDGDFQVAWGGFFTGDLDDVMFYNIALDGPQVKSIFENQNTL